MPFYVWETKTTSDDIGLGSTYWKRLNLDSQISLYLKAAKLLGYECDGVLYSVLRKPAHRPMTTKNETAEAYGRRVLAAIVEQPEKFFQRGIIVRLEADRKEADADVWQTAANMRDARRMKIYPRNPDACVQWSRACEFLPVCCGEQSIDDPLLFKRAETKHTELDVVRNVCPDCGHSPCLGSCWRTHAPPGVDTSFTTREILTQSSMRTYRACPRKYYYRYELLVRSLKEPEVFKTGKSLHRAVEHHMKSGGDLDAAIAALDTDDPYQFAKESAMIHAYHAYWPKPEGVIGVEQEWTTPLVNPETGASSKTFVLAGRFDGLVEGERERFLRAAG